MRIRFLRAARLDLFGAATFYESEAERLRAEFLATVGDALDLLASNPRIGSVYEAEHAPS